MEFSVLMSVYRKEVPEFFDLSLKSNLIDQTRKPDEMVLVCDGPLTSELDAVIEKYEKLCPQLKVYRLRENGGLGKALNYGLSRCSFELVARSDSDDVCDSTRFEKQINFMQEHPEIDFVSSAIDEFNTDWHQPHNVKHMPTTHDELVQMTKMRNPMNHMAVVFKKTAVLACGSYIHQQYTEDYFLWVRAMANGSKFANIDECLVHARVGNGMTARRGSRTYIGSWKELSDFMIEHKMINRIEYIKRMISIVGFVYIPTGLKAFVYKKLLRR